MTSHRFMNSLLYLIIQCVEEEDKAKENIGVLRILFGLFIDRCHTAQVSRFKFF